MNTKDKYNFENIRPSSVFTKINFKVKIANDFNIIKASRLNRTLSLGKPRLVMLSVGIYIFFLFLSFNIFNISVNQKKINYVNNSKSEIINRGKILDRNKNIISATIPTFDLYLDTKKIINIDNARKEIIKIYPEKEKFLENIFKKKNTYLSINIYPMSNVLKLMKLVNLDSSFILPKKEFIPKKIYSLTLLAFYQNLVNLKVN